MSSTPTVWIVTVPSAIDSHQCFIGQGGTKADAMADAYGPKPWPKTARLAKCYQVTKDEAQALRDNQ